MDNGLVLCNEVKYGTSDFAVLILIIVDNGLVLCNEVKYGTSDFAVLILIIVDNGLVPKIRQNMPELSCCINPCCSGQWSRTHSSQYDDWTACTVLILIVVEDGLVHNNYYCEYYSQCWS